MLNTAKIKIRDIKELQGEPENLSTNAITPLRKRKNPKPSTAKKKTLNVPEQDEKIVADNNATTSAVKKTATAKKLLKSAVKETPSNQKRIDSFFSTCAKNFTIPKEAPTPLFKANAQTSVKKSRGARNTNTSGTRRNNRKSPRRPKAGRKRLFSDSSETSGDGLSQLSTIKENKKMEPVICISLDSDSENEFKMETVSPAAATQTPTTPLTDLNMAQTSCTSSAIKLTLNEYNISNFKHEQSAKECLNLGSENDLETEIESPAVANQTLATKGLNTVKTAISSSATKASLTEDNISNPNHKPPYKVKETTILLSDSEDEIKTEIVCPALSHQEATSSSRSSKSSKRKTTTKTETNTKNKNASSVASPERSVPKTSTSVPVPFSRRKLKPCPPYKIIEGTTFAVDAFQFGYIKDVTHYFLTHFHADHYIGLTKSFARPIYMSPITARLLRTFIPVEEEYIHELELNTTITVNNIEITALNANHCPGAILLVFKFDGKCILHTGDFRASPEMETEPILWNNHINTIYLDTTYISDKYAFCSQYESINRAKNLIEKFHEKHSGKRILYICGSYVIGKEKFWCELAKEYHLKVWTESNRYKALKAINDEEINEVLIEDPHQANMHVIAMKKISYLELVEYFKLYEQDYDIIFAMRPSGWEKDSKPRYGKKINLIGIEYSEHSSYAEMQRFVKFIKPDNVISTVPTGRDLMKTAVVPQNWYKYKVLKPLTNYQPSIDSFLAKTPLRKTSIRLPNMNKGGVENFVSPLKPLVEKENDSNNNLNVIDTEMTENLCNNVGKALNTSNSFQTNPLENPVTSNSVLLRTPAISKTTTSRMSINSSEDFERPDPVINLKRSQTIKKELKSPNNSFEKLKRPARSQINRRNKNKSKGKQPEVLKRESQENGANIENNRAEASTSFNASFGKRKSPKIPKKSSSNKNKAKNREKKNISNSSEDEFQSTQLQTSIKIVEHQENQKRITRSRSKNSSETVTSSKSSQNLNKKSKQNKITFNTDSQVKSSGILSKSQRNPILKSNTTTSVDSPEDEETHTNNDLKTKKIKMLKIGANENFERPKGSKRLTFDETNTSPFKKSRTSLDPNALVKSLIENNENIDRFNCSQLAGLVVETCNELKSEESNNDHIPTELLSNTDDELGENLQFSVSQKRVTRNKSSSTETPESQNKDEQQLIAKLLKLKQENSQHKSAIKTLQFKENPIFKSSTSIESKSTDSHGSQNKTINATKLNGDRLNTISQTKSTTKLSKAQEDHTSYKTTSTSNNSLDLDDHKTNGSEKNDIPTTSQRQTTFNRSFSTPTNKSRISLDTKQILDTILETNENINRFNCSQLAGLVVETLNKHEHPDNSTDHIPRELLSDADDDWIY